MTLITSALKQGDRLLALTLIQQANSYQINQCDQDGQSALHIAVQKHDLMIVEALIKKGAMIEGLASDPCYKNMTPLHYAALTGDLEACRLLLKSGANAQARNGQHLTPAKLAFQHGFSKVGTLIEQSQTPSQSSSLLYEIQRMTLGLKNSSVESIQARHWLALKQPTQNNVVSLLEYRTRRPTHPKRS